MAAKKKKRIDSSPDPLSGGVRFNADAASLVPAIPMTIGFTEPQTDCPC